MALYAVDISSRLLRNTETHSTCQNEFAIDDRCLTGQKHDTISFPASFKRAVQHSTSQNCMKRVQASFVRRVVSCACRVLLIQHMVSSDLSTICDEVEYRNAVASRLSKLSAPYCQNTRRYRVSVLTSLPLQIPRLYSSVMYSQARIVKARIVKVGLWFADETKLAPSVTNTFFTSCSWLYLFSTEAFRIIAHACSTRVRG